MLPRTALALAALFSVAPPAHADDPDDRAMLDGFAGLDDDLDGAPPAADAPLPLRSAPVRTTRLAGGPWFGFSAGRDHLLLYGLRGGVLHGPTGKPRKVSLPGRPYRVAVAPAGGLIAYIGDTASVVRVIDVATGAVRWQGSFDTAYSGMNVGFRDDRTLLISTGCRVVAVEVTTRDATPRPVGARLCDDASRPATDLGDDHFYGDRTWYRLGAAGAGPRLLDAVSGREYPLPWDRAVDMAVADDGRVACAGRRYHRLPDITCARPGGRAWVAVPGVPRALEVSPDGAVLGALIVVDDERAEVVVVDLATGVRRVLGETTDTRLRMVGHEPVTAHGPDGGATLWRPDRGYRVRFLAGQEIDYVAPTADPASFLVAVARGAGEVYHRVRVGEPAPAATAVRAR